MGAYSFKRRFVPFILDWSKTHTIRAERSNPDESGDVLHLFTAMRTVNCQLLMRAACVKVEPILIYERGSGTFGVVIAGHKLSLDEKDTLAWRDGFRNYDQSHTGAFVEMVRFWVEEHGDGREVSVNRANLKTGEPQLLHAGKTLDFRGHIIHWDPAIQYSKIRHRLLRIEPAHPLYVKGAAA